MLLEDILKDTDFKRGIFTAQEEQTFMDRVHVKEDSKGKKYYIQCLVRNKQIKLTPEEAIRQLCIDKLNQEYGYPVDNIQVEYPEHY